MSQRSEGLSRRESLAAAVATLGAGLGVLPRTSQAAVAIKAKFFSESSQIASLDVPDKVAEILERGKDVEARFVSGSKTLGTVMLKGKF